MGVGGGRKGNYYYCVYRFKHFLNKSGESTFFEKKQTNLPQQGSFYVKKKKLPTSQAPNEDIFFIMIIQDFLR